MATNQLPYGVNILASDMKNILERNDIQQNGIRSWRQLLGNASLSNAAQTDTIKSEYSDAISKAYRANFEQDNAIMGAGLNVGATRELLNLSRQDLATAYDTYVRNYNQDMATAAETYGAEVGAIDSALTERAENFASLYNYAYKYLTDEISTGQIFVQNPDDPVYSGEGKNKELTGYNNSLPLSYLSQNNMDWLLDSETGNIRSWDSLSQDLFDTNGALTDKGIQYFDQLMNARPEGYVNEKGESLRSFDEWLAEADPDLRTWFASPDLFNYNFAGTNAGTSRILTGRESTDFAYHDYEYLKPEAIDAINTSFTNNENLKEVNKWLLAAEQVDKSHEAGDYGSSTAWVNSLENYDKKTKAAWTKYAEDVGKSLSTFETTLSEQFGTDLYNEFREEYSDLFTEFNDLYKSLLTDETYVKSDFLETKKLQEYYGKMSQGVEATYRKLVEAANEYAKTKGFSRNISGF